MQALKNIAVLMWKEWRSLFSDAVLGVLLAVVFTVMVYQTAAGGGTDLRNATVGVVDDDRSALSRQIADALPQPYFARPQAVTLQEAEAGMDKGGFIFVLVFPPDFERDVLSGRPAEAQLLVDATAMTQAGMGQAYITQIFNREILQFLGLADTAEALVPVKAVLNTAFNPNRESAWFLGAMQVNNMVMLLGLVLVGAAVIREREQGTMAHLLVMPVSSSQIVLAKILANGLVVCAAAALSMKLVVGGVIGADFGGSVWLYFGGTLVFMFSIAALAVMLATLAPTMPQYSLLMVPVYVVALMFSGANSPRSNMPETAQWISEYWPTTQFASFAQNVLFRGAGWDSVWPQLAMMAGSGALFLLPALRRFKAMLEKQG
ncbi:ABC transporter permease [Neisseria leonii]|uniref:ABC transporter permease n=1 Tax=Neisseria leonii TaxID=2995413 RepID=A0A9X4E389_9NEIS|nr:ABC transporter permease [Neisseria sp. 51.81]MDD9327151.1 ABC transporter permease [Neisseria sp. 51.81]